MRAALLALVMVAGCKSDKPKATAEAPAGSGSSAPSADVEAIPPEVAALPGELWFVADDPHRIVRLAGGVSRDFTGERGELFPSAARLPDGRIVAIASRGDGSAEAEQLVLIGEDGAQTAIGPAAPQVRDPVVVDDGAAIIAALRLDGRSELYRIEVPGGALKRLTDNPEGNYRPTWIHGNAIAFVSSRDGDSEIYRSDTRGGGLVRMTAFHRDDWEPSPSPDGSELAFISDREGPPRLFVVKTDGTGLRRLTDRGVQGDERELEERELVWSRDGAWIAYVLARGGKTQVVLRSMRDGRERIVTPVDAADVEPTFSPDGRWFVVSRSRGKDSDLWAVPTGAGEPIRITRAAGTERLARWW